MKASIEVTFDIKTGAEYLKLDGFLLHRTLCEVVQRILQENIYLYGVEVSNIETSHFHSSSLSDET